METHLRSEPDIEADDKPEIGNGISGDGGCRLFPVHLVFYQETISYREFTSLDCVCYRITSRPDASWEPVPFFQRLDREFVLRSLFHERCGHLSASPGDGLPTLYGGDERCNFGLVFSVLLRIRDVDWWKDVLTIRLFVGDDEVVDIDCTFVRLMREGLRFFGELRRTQPHSVPKVREDGIGVPSSAAAAVPNEDLGGSGISGQQSAVPGGVVPGHIPRGPGDFFHHLPENLMPGGGGFFEIDDGRKLSGEMEERLAKFAVKRVAASDFGPLEPPSKIRGREVRPRRGEFFRDDESVPEPVPVRSRTDRWFGNDNAIRVSSVQEVLGVRRFAVIWYSESRAAGVDVDTGRMDDGEAAVVSFQNLRRWETAVTRACSRVSEELTKVVSRFGGLVQRFHVNIDSALRGRDLVQLLWLSRDAWLVSATGSGCIIKALSHDLHRRRLDGGVNAGWRAGWADVIWYARGRVASGIPIKLLRVGPHGLWRSYFLGDRGVEGGTIERGVAAATLAVAENGSEDLRLTGWELDTEVCVLYAFHDRSLLWSLPGGFCVAFRLSVDDAVAQTIREKFKMR